MSKRRSFYRNLDLKRCLVMSSPFLVAAMASQGLSATTYSVTDVATLRAAIDSANATTTDDIINLDPGTYGLTGAAQENANASGDLDITKAGGSLLIQSNGGTVTIENNGNDRLLHVNAPGTTIVIQNIGLSGGTAWDNGTTIGDAYGGGILLEQGSLTLNNVDLSSNSASAGASSSSSTSTPGANGGNSFGGGIYVAGGTLTVNDSLFVVCRANAENGNSGGSSSSASTFTDGGDGGAARGGAIYVAGGTVVIRSCDFSNNNADGGNGGDGGSRNTSSGNPGFDGGDGGIGEGGAIYVAGGSVTVIAGDFDGNSAVGGDAGSGGDGGSNSAFTAVSAFGQGGDGGSGGTGGTGSGGAICISGGSLTISNSTVAFGTTTGGQGGYGGRGGSAFAAASTNASAFGGDGGQGGIGGSASGGGIHISGGTVTVESSTISNNQNTAGDGGAGGNGGSAYAFANLTGAFSQSGAGGDGGDGGDSNGAGISCLAGTLDISNSTIADNSSSEGSGGYYGNGNSSGSAGNDGTSSGGGLFNGGGTVTINSSILGGNADNSGSNDTEDLDGAVTAGASLFQTNPTGSTITPGTGTNIVGQDPLLSALADNGGPTWTHAIATGSPARNVGSNPLTLFTDQRGFSRDDGGGVDMGAYEFGSTAATTPTPTVTDPAATITLDAATYNIQGMALANSLVRIYSDLNDDGIINGADAIVGAAQLTGGATAFSISTPLTQSATNAFLVTAQIGAAGESAVADVPTITEQTGGSSSGDDDDDSNCSTGGSPGSNWLLFGGLLAAMFAMLRRGFRREDA